VRCLAPNQQYLVRKVTRENFEVDEITGNSFVCNVELRPEVSACGGCLWLPRHKRWRAAVLKWGCRRFPSCGCFSFVRRWSFHALPCVRGGGCRARVVCRPYELHHSLAIPCDSLDWCGSPISLRVFFWMSWCWEQVFGKSDSSGLRVERVHVEKIEISSLNAVSISAAPSSVQSLCP
jgi:hypothetical protein